MEKTELDKRLRKFNDFYNNYEQFLEPKDRELLAELLERSQEFLKSKAPTFFKNIVIVSVAQKVSPKTIKTILEGFGIYRTKITFLSKPETIKNHNLLEKIKSSKRTLFLIGEVPHKIAGSDDIIAIVEEGAWDNVTVLRDRTGRLKLSKDSLRKALVARLQN
ncbi:hypothetical protein H6776_02965 [Candidatus Nomurabacteria bacterium]|nr:hypothetical protein [Candidatus Nomurabacteria bacterium]